MKYHGQKGRYDLSFSTDPGLGTAPDADLGFPRIRATVQAAPSGEHAQKKYRANA